jgi:hypothetical protein
MSNSKQNINKRDKPNIHTGSIGIMTTTFSLVGVIGLFIWFRRKKGSG